MGATHQGDPSMWARCAALVSTLGDVLTAVTFLVSGAFALAGWLRLRARKKRGERASKSYLRLFRYTLVALGLSVTVLVLVILSSTVFAPRPELVCIGDAGPLLTSANVSNGDTHWREKLAGKSRAKVGDTIAFCVRFCNRTPHTIAENTIVRALFPWAEARQPAVLAAVWANGADPLQGTATVELSASARLTYVQGSTRLWRDGHVTECMDGVTSRSGLNVGTTGFVLNDAYATSVTFLAKVEGASPLAVDLYVGVPGTGNRWSWILQDRREGDRLAWKVAVRNHGPLPLENVLVRCDLPSKVIYWPGTATYFGPDAPPNGYRVPDGICQDGLALKRLAPGADNVVYFVFEASIDYGLRYGPGNTSELVAWAHVGDEPRGSADQAKVTVCPDRRNEQ